MAASNSSIAVNIPFVCKRGDTFERELQFVDQSDDPVDITSFTFTMEVSIIGLSFSIGAGITVTPPNILTMNKTATQMDLKPGTYFYDFKQIDGPVVTTIMTGSFTIDNDVTI